jgi:aquaporin Z
MNPLPRRMTAEAFGTFWLTFGGCGAAVISAGFHNNTSGPALNIGFLGVALAFGLTVLTMVYTVGPISGAHLNPAITVGLWLAKRFSVRDVIPYIVAQVVGAIVAAGVLYVIASGAPGWTPGQFAANGYGDLSPGGYAMSSAFIAEFVLTFFFIWVVVGSTDKRAPVGFAGIAIGLVLTLIHLISIPIDNTSVNPARSTGPAIFAGPQELSQLWLFWVAPILGGGIAGFLYPLFFGEG